MKFLKALVFLAILSLIIISSKGNAEAPIIPVVVITPPTIEELISFYAIKYGIDEVDFLAVAKCESRLEKNAIHFDDGGKGKHSVGLFQFQESTFLAWEKKIGEDLNYYSYHDQIKLASYMFSKGQQNQWSCYRLIK